MKTLLWLSQPRRCNVFSNLLHLSDPISSIQPLMAILGLRLGCVVTVISNNLFIPHSPSLFSIPLPSLSNITPQRRLTVRTNNNNIDYNAHPSGNATNRGQLQRTRSRTNMLGNSANTTSDFSSKDISLDSVLSNSPKGSKSDYSLAGNFLEKSAAVPNDRLVDCRSY